MQTITEAVSLDPLLDDLEREAGAALAHVSRLSSLVKKIQGAAQTGNLRELRKGLETLNALSNETHAAVGTLHRHDRWSEDDEEKYLSSRVYLDELVGAAQAAGINVQIQEGGTLACFPSLLKVQPKERAVKLDGKLQREIRPRHLAAQLAGRQKRPLKVNLARLVETLQNVYDQCSKSRGEIVPVLEIYRRLTVLPWVAKEYGQQEFARDLYLLDAAPDVQPKDGSRVRLHPGATAAKNRANLLVVVTREGAERTYYGIEFSEGRAQ